MKSLIIDKIHLDLLSNIEKKKYLQKVRLVKLLHADGANSNADIYNILGISSPTSFTLINELVSEGLIEKKGKGQSIGGRKPELYSLQNSSFFVLCIKMEQFKTDIAILDNNNNNISGINSLPLHITKEKDSIIEIHEFAEQLIHSSGINRNKLVGVGISMPGLVDSNTGQNFTYLTSPKEPKTLKDIFEEKFQKPVYIQNDVKTNALAEYHYGLAKNKKDVLVLLMDWGIGLGIIMDGKLQSGTSGFAGEIGHIPFVSDGELCHCGKRGCLETVVSGIAMAKMARDGIRSGQASILKKLSEEEIEQIVPFNVIEAANQGDQFAINILSQVGQSLGKAVATLIQLFNPELIILGGIMAQAKQYISIPMKHAINTYSMAQVRENTKIVLSELGNDAGLLGLADIVMEGTFKKQIELVCQKSTLSDNSKKAC
ncbi:ROK family protein (putative glucokinase) [Daejeonella rubra]|uniref:ROK family protein (Putative glucokinase) n=1 Tax=Daejeonella rubra TaxID=990371 RepID=A0A1G9SW27_9SPHI|nr:ROK family protein [Daejeonella rubra]SDM39612.1 ROK family protein (putative glucokinase) [Daejeonella rubra]